MPSRVRVPINVATIYRKVLLPIDGSREAEKILPIIKDRFPLCREAILLHIIPRSPLTRWLMGQHGLLGHRPLQDKCTEATDYLWRVVYQLGGDPMRWRCEVVISETVCQGILDFAINERVDLIAMYTHDRKGLAKLIKKSIAKQVQLRAPMEVKVVTPQKLDEYMSAALKADSLRYA
jgi:hypothetical protein